MKRIVIFFFFSCSFLLAQQNTPLDTFVPNVVRFHGAPPGSIGCLAHQLAFDEVGSAVYFCNALGLWQSAPSGISVVSVAPSGSCTAGATAQMVSSTGVIYTCQSGTWGNVGGGGGTIGGSIAANQVAFGSGVNAIQGVAGFTFTPLITGLVTTTSNTDTGTTQAAAFTNNFIAATTAAQVVGLFGAAQNTSSGTVSRLVGIDGIIHNTSTGTVTEADALFAGVNGAEPAIGLFVGLRIQDHTTVGATSSFGQIFDNGLNAISFNGAVSGQVLSVSANNLNVGKAPTGGSFNLFLGTGTTGGVTTTTGTNNLCINASNLTCFFSVTSGSSNIAIGRSSLFSLTTGSFNTTVGNNFGSVTTGSNNTAVGNLANAGGGNVSNVSAFGNQALQANQATEASAFGNQSQGSNTTGLNSSFGSLSLLSNTTGTNNDVFGEDTLRDNVAGNRNVAMGDRALQSTNGGNDNVAIGHIAGFTATSANANVTGNFNTWIGSGSGPGSATQFSNQTVVGAGGLATCNNCVVSSTDNTFGTNILNAASPCETAFGTSTLTAAYTTGLNCLPANSVIDAVIYRITTTITGTTTSFTIGDGTTAARFCAAQSTLTVGTTGICMVQWTSATAGTMGQVAAAAAKFTANGTITAGAMRLIVYYHTWSVPTS